MNKKFKPLSLIRFALPSVCMMMVLSLYTIVDGLFVSNFVGTDALGAVNIVYPIISIGFGISIMIASGGSALIGKKLGEGKPKEANSIFTFLIVFLVFIAVLFLIVGSIAIGPLVHMLGATERQFEMAKSYLQIHLFFVAFFYLQNVFQILFVTAGRPQLGLFTTLGAGVLNILLDYIFIVILKLGINGAALGTGLSYLVVSITGLIYFTFNKKGMIRFSKFRIQPSALKEAMTNGSSEMLTNIANAVSTFLFNYQFLKFYQEDGVAAITIVLYFQFLISAAFFGYAQGIAPIISYKYGMKDIKEVKRIRKYSILTILCFGVFAFGMSLGLIIPVAKLFASNNFNVYQIVVDNFWMFSFSFLLMGVSIITSSYFTAVSDGFASAVISFMRTLGFLSLCILVLPLLMGSYGLWLSITLAEVFGLVTSLLFLKHRKIKNLDLELV